MKADHWAKVPSSQGRDEDTTGSDEMSAGRAQEKNITSENRLHGNTMGRVECTSEKNK